MFVGWEVVGFCSYLLINFWFTSVQAKKVAVKAMVVKIIGDFGLVSPELIGSRNCVPIAFTAENPPTHRVSTPKLVPVTGVTFESHHGSINVQLSFPNCCFVYLLRYRPNVSEHSSQLCFTSTRSFEISKID